MLPMNLNALPCMWVKYSLPRDLGFSVASSSGPYWTHQHATLTLGISAHQGIVAAFFIPPDRNECRCARVLKLYLRCEFFLFLPKTNLECKWKSTAAALLLSERCNIQFSSVRQVLDKGLTFYTRLQNALLVSAAMPVSQTSVNICQL